MTAAMLDLFFVTILFFNETKGKLKMQVKSLVVSTYVVLLN